jgi:hypothetical protein
MKYQIEKRNKAHYVYIYDGKSKQFYRLDKMPRKAKTNYTESYAKKLAKMAGGQVMLATQYRY